MGISQLPGIEPATGDPATANVIAYTKSLVTLAQNALTAVDATGTNVNSFLSVNTSNIGSVTGAVFSATVISNGDRFRFEAKHYNPAGPVWQPTAAMAMPSGYWDYEHRCYDAGGFYAFAVPALGATDLRMVRVAGTAGANTCTAGVNATHGGFPFPPKYVGKRDVTLMVRSAPLAAGTLTMVPFDVDQENDDRTRTLALPQANNSRPVRLGRRFWIQGWDVAYSPVNAADRARVILLSNVAGVTTVASNPKAEIAVLNAPGRSLHLSEPLEFQNALGSGQMQVGIAANGISAGGLLTMTVFGFETL